MRHENYTVIFKNFTFVNKSFKSEKDTIIHKDPIVEKTRYPTPNSNPMLKSSNTVNKFNVNFNGTALNVNRISNPMHQIKNKIKIYESSHSSMVKSSNNSINSINSNSNVSSNKSNKRSFSPFGVTTASSYKKQVPTLVRCNSNVNLNVIKSVKETENFKSKKMTGSSSTNILAKHSRAHSSITPYVKK